MSVKIKIIIAAVSIPLFMLLLPFLAIKLCDPTDVMGIFILAFFAVNPLLTVVLSAMAGSELGKLWWFPLAIAALFPLLFAAAIGEFTWDLYLYSLIYLLLGTLTMTSRYVIRKIASRKEREKV